MADVQEGLDLRRRARRRLIGAIALVLALVVVPPWIMDLEPRSAPTRLSVEIPAQDASRLKPPPKPPAGGSAPAATGTVKPQDATQAPPAAIGPKPPAAPTGAAPARSLDSRTVAALGAPKTGAPPESDATKPAAEATKPTGEAMPPGEKVKPAAKAAEAAKPSTEAVRAQAALGGVADAFIVPLGAFGNAENAKQLQARLAKEGIETFAEPVRTAAGEQTRVRAGPYATRDAAEKARERVKGMGIDAGNVVTRQ